MRSNSDIIKKLTNQYFWDVDLSGLGTPSAKRIIIERIFTLGDIDEIKLVISYYGKDDVIDVLKNISYLDHRKSIDIDLFTNIDFTASELLEQIQQNFPYQLFQTASNTLKGCIGNTNSNA